MSLMKGVVSFILALIMVRPVGVFVEYIFETISTNISVPVTFSLANNLFFISLTFILIFSLVFVAFGIIGIEEKLRL